jgi:hypothetical protein
VSDDTEDEMMANDFPEDYEGDEDDAYDDDGLLTHGDD